MDAIQRDARHFKETLLVNSSESLALVTNEISNLTNIIAT